MNTTELDKIDRYRHLLPDPAPQVVGQLIEEVRAMREAIREAHGALFRLSEEWKYQAKIGNVPDDRVEANLSAAALTKLQPYLDQ
jgi:hypothetical protein